MYTFIRYSLLTILVVALAIIAAAAFSMPAAAHGVTAPMCLKDPPEETAPLIAPNVTARYVLEDAPIISDDYSTTIGGYWWLSGPVGGDFAVGSVLVPIEQEVLSK